MADEEGLAIDFYRPSDTSDLASHVISLLESPQLQQEMATQNFSAALRMTMPRIIHEYIHHFGVEQSTKAIKSMTRLRRLPRWMPARLFAGTSVRRNRTRWSERSVFVPEVRMSSSLLDRNGLRGRGFDASRNRSDGDGVTLPGNGSGSDGTGRTPNTTTATSAGARQNGHSGNGAQQPGTAEPLFGQLKKSDASNSKYEPTGTDG
jgi:hypothetical protein